MRLWLFDFDGTVSPLVSDRNAAVMHPACANILKELSQSSNDWVAVLSSRTLEDLLPRIPLDNIIVGGNSGMSWQLPGGCRLSPGADKEDLLYERRQKIMPMIEKLESKHGIEIEDKKWSVAIHVTTSEHAVTHKKLIKTIMAWAERESLTIHRGPNVLEVQFIDGFNKSVGASFLAKVLKVDTQRDTIVYAGDDENDAVAMWWTLMTGGTAIMVGTKLDVAGAVYVKDQQALIETVHMLRKSFDIP
jgi:trehalose 6-phosphate phosphatase